MLRKSLKKKRKKSSKLRKRKSKEKIQRVNIVKKKSKARLKRNRMSKESQSTWQRLKKKSSTNFRQHSSQLRQVPLLLNIRHQHQLSKSKVTSKKHSNQWLSKLNNKIPSAWLCHRRSFRASEILGPSSHLLKLSKRYLKSWIQHQSMWIMIRMQWCHDLKRNRVEIKANGLESNM